MLNLIFFFVFSSVFPSSNRIFAYFLILVVSTNLVFWWSIFLRKGYMILIRKLSFPSSTLLNLEFAVHYYFLLVCSAPSLTFYYISIFFFFMRISSLYDLCMYLSNSSLIDFRSVVEFDYSHWTWAYPSPWTGQIGKVSETVPAELSTVVENC